MTGVDIKAGTRVVGGHVVEVVKSIALVAFDDGRKSALIHVNKIVLPQVGRPPGRGVRAPKLVKAVKAVRILSSVLRAEMEKQDLTWDALSARSHVSRATIARLLADDMKDTTLDTVEALAGALGISPSRFWE